MNRLVVLVKVALTIVLFLVHFVGLAVACRKWRLFDYDLVLLVNAMGMRLPMLILMFLMVIAVTRLLSMV